MRFRDNRAPQPHGDSQWSIGDSYAMVDYTLDVVQATVIGHSLGGSHSGTSAAPASPAAAPRPLMNARGCTAATAP